MVRTCGLDSNEQTADVELVRVAHTCGIFKFEANPEEAANPKKRKLSGCIDVCEGPDGCNGASAAALSHSLIAVAMGCLLLARGLDARPTARLGTSMMTR